MKKRREETIKSDVYRPEITVGHRTISDHFAQLSDQILCCSTVFSEQQNF